MTAQGFGRKGLTSAAPASRRAAFIAPAPVEIDEGALRRAAFAAEERARREQAAEPATAFPEIEAGPPADRKLGTAWALWLATGLAGGHRFYLRRPITGALQAFTFLGSWGGTLAEYYAAFAGVGIACLWWIVDGLFIPRLHRTAWPR